MQRKRNALLQLPIFFRNCICCIYLQKDNPNLDFSIRGKDAEPMKTQLENDERTNLNNFSLQNLIFLLKIFLKELSEPVFTFEQYVSFLDAYDIAHKSTINNDSDSCTMNIIELLVDELSPVVSLLPQLNKDMCFLLFQLLFSVSNVRNNEEEIARVFAPLLIYPEDEYVYRESSSVDNEKLVVVVVALILKHNEIFESQTTTSIEKVLVDYQNEYGTGNSNSNNKTPEQEDEEEKDVARRRSRSISSSFLRKLDKKKSNKSTEDD